MSERPEEAGQGKGAWVFVAEAKSSAPFGPLGQMIGEAQLRGDVRGRATPMRVHVNQLRMRRKRRGLGFWHVGLQLGMRTAEGV